jgi:hypothetical protein
MAAYPGQRVYYSSSSGDINFNGSNQIYPYNLDANEPPKYPYKQYKDDLPNYETAVNNLNKV